MAAAMALGIEMEGKQLPNETAQMSAVAVGFFLDREGHKKFLKTASNQELEVENKKLKQELADKTEECGYWHTEAKSYEIGREELGRELSDTKRVLSHIRSVLTQKRKELETERDEKHALEMRIMNALHPEEEKAEEEGDSCQEEEEADNSPSPSFGDAPGPHDFGDPDYQFDGGNDGNPEGFL